MEIRQRIKKRKEDIIDQVRKIRSGFAGSSKWFHAASLLFLGVFMGNVLSSLVRRPWLGWMIGVMLAVPVGLLFSMLAGWLLRRIVICDGKSLFWSVADLTMLYVSAEYGSIGAKEEQIILTVLLLFFAAALFVKSAYLLLKKRVRKAGVVLLCAFTGGVTAFFIWLLGSEGFSDTYVKTYLAEEKQVENPVGEGFASYGGNGTCTVETLCYSNREDADLKTEPVDLSRYVMESEEIEEWYRDFFQSEDLEAVPVAGKIWYPKEETDCPVIFIAHGNHSITEESYLGYEYLGTYFASLGYVFVSVDENALNERSGENDGRAILLLENIKMILQCNHDAESPLYQKIDPEKIGLAGHSRGGEMIADAYLFSEYENYPSNGMFELNYPFSVKALLAVAPSYGQYEPADHMVELSDVNYMVIQGANDQDVSVFMGNEQYENVSFTGEGDYRKISLYLAGANHGQFNTLWGKYDMEPPFSWWLNVADFISQDEQQYLLKVFSRAFFDVTLKGDTTYESLLYDEGRYERYLPKTLYAQQYDTSSSRLIADFEEDSDVTTATDGSVCDAVHMAMWTEERITDSDENRGERENHGLYLKWDHTREAEYEIVFGENRDLSGGAFSFDICNLNEEQETVGDGVLDFTVYFIDSAGNRAYAKVGDLVTLHPSYPVRLSKIQYLYKDAEWKYPFQTVAIRQKDLTCEMEDFNLEQVRRVVFTFDSSDNGKFWMDNIRYEIK